MPLSISSSEVVIGAPATLRRRSIEILLGVILLLLIGLEAGTRMVVERRSKVQREVNQERRAAVELRPNPAPGAPKHLLVVGNSIVGQDLDFGLLQSELKPAWQASRFWIYATNYEDWHFGLRRLFADGSRPDVVAVTMAAMNWNAVGIRGDYSARYLFRPQDVPAIGKALDVDRTTTSNLLFARYSAFYALRSEVRKQVLHALVPDLPAMYNLFKPTVGKRVSSEELAERVGLRVKQLKVLVEQHGARLIMIVPPIPRPGEEYQDELRAAAQAAGVAMVAPMTMDDVPRADFEDDVHLRPAGAKLFTESLREPFLQALGGGR